MAVVPATPSAADLRLGDLMDIDDFAEAAGVLPRTLHTYRNSKRTDYDFPEPVARIGIIPVWTSDQVAAWIANRPGSGARFDLYRQGRGLPDQAVVDAVRGQLL